MDEIIKVFENHFIQLYKSRKKASFEILLDHLNERKNEAGNDVKEITIDEILKAINALNAELTGIGRLEQPYTFTRFLNEQVLHCYKVFSIIMFKRKKFPKANKLQP